MKLVKYTRLKDPFYTNQLMEVIQVMEESYEVWYMNDTTKKIISGWGLKEHFIDYNKLKI